MTSRSEYYGIQQSYTYFNKLQAWMDARFNALARAIGGRLRFTTLHTFVKKMVAIALSSVAVARQSALTRKVQGTAS